MRKLKFRMGALPKVTQLLKDVTGLHTSSSGQAPVLAPPCTSHIPGVTRSQNKLVRVYH